MARVDYNECFNVLSSAISTLIEKKVEKFLILGLSEDDAFSLCLEALESATETWDEEGYEIIESLTLDSDLKRDDDDDDTPLSSLDDDDESSDDLDYDLEDD